MRFSQAVPGGRNQVFGNSRAPTHGDGGRQHLRLPRLHPRVGRRHDRQLVASILPVAVDAAALPVHAPDERGDAVLCEPHQCFRRRRALPATTRTRSTGDHRSCGSPAASRGSAASQAAANSNVTHAVGAEILSSRGRHALTVGGDVRRQRWSILSQQDARGAFNFSGNATGSDLADFLLGLPHSSSIAFGNADKEFAAPSVDAYFTDDWRVSPVLTVNAGMRWEYEAPIDERFGRLATLEVAPGFASRAAGRRQRSDPAR